MLVAGLVALVGCSSETPTVDPAEDPTDDGVVAADWPRNFENTDGSITAIPAQPKRIASTTVTTTGTLTTVLSPGRSSPPSSARLTRNPLAEPGLLGVNAGAALLMNVADTLGRVIPPRGEVSVGIMVALIGGQSLGGLCATTPAIANPELYGTAVSQSGSFWWPSATPFEQGRNATAQLCSIHEGPFPRFVMEWGAPEWEVRGNSRRVHDVLRARGADITATERSGGRDVAWWERTLPEAIARAFACQRRPTIGTWVTSADLFHSRTPRPHRLR